MSCVTPFVGVWIETSTPLSVSMLYDCHTLRGCVDWNLRYGVNAPPSPCHTLRGCVDWNSSKPNPATWYPVTPFVGVWIETIMASRLSLWKLCHTLRGCVDWNSWSDCEFGTRYKSHPSWVCGLKHFTAHCHTSTSLSHPSWVCGLKPEGFVVITIAVSHTLRGCVDINEWMKCRRIWKEKWLFGNSEQPLNMVFLESKIHRRRGKAYSTFQLSKLLLSLEKFTPTFMILLPSSAKFLAKSGCFSLFNSEIEWNIRENL